MSGCMAVEITIGSGQSNFKTTTYRAARQLAARANFQHLDNIAITPAFFRHFLEASGALSSKSSKDAQKCISDAYLSTGEISQIKEAVHALPGTGLNRLCLFVRSDEPWEGSGTGLGSSYIAIRRGKSQISLINSVVSAIKWALESQFDELGNVAEFKRLKGAVEDFGVLIMPVFANFYPNGKRPEKVFAPSLSVNFLGKAYGNALMQCSRGFFSNSFYGARAVAHARGRSFSSINLDGRTEIYGTSAKKANFQPGFEALYQFAVDNN